MEGRRGSGEKGGWRAGGGGEEVNNSGRERVEGAVERGQRMQVGGKQLTAYK